jgi:hypothetical protein
MLQNKAMLANLSISRWQARKTDKKVTREVTEAHQAAAGSGDFRKTLVDKAHLKALKTSESAIRDYHYSMTLPWDDDGRRVLPSKSYEAYTERNRQLREADEKLRRDFISIYPSLVETAPKRLGSMFDPKDFPTADQIADKFDIRISLEPIPSAEDFRVNVGDEAAAQIRAEITAENEAKFAKAMKDCFTRMHDVVSHINRTLSRDDPRIFDSLVTNARDLVECLPALNLSDDPLLEQLRQELHVMLPHPDALRASPTTRKRLAKDAEALLGKMKGYV